MMTKLLKLLALSLSISSTHASADKPTSDAKIAPFVGLHPGRFAGKVCFITGATSGLGEHAAYHLAQEGCAVAVTGRREEKGLAVVEHIKSLGDISTLDPPAVFIKVDVTKLDSLTAAVAKIEETWGRLDAVFANAGVVEMTPIGSGSVDSFAWIMDVNVNGVMRTMEASVPLLKTSGGGSIVLCSSVYGLRATPLLSAYIASKHALEGLKKSAAGELLPLGIRVNNLNPSFTPSEMTSGFVAMPLFYNGVIQEVQPDRMMSEMMETSSALAYLLSSDSQYINGLSLPVDGGMVNNIMNPISFTTATMGAVQEAQAAAEAAAKEDL